MPANEKPITTDEIHLGYIKILASYHMVVGDRETGKALHWASHHIENLRQQLTEAGCVACNVQKRREVLGDPTEGVHLATVIPFRREE